RPAAVPLTPEIEARLIRETKARMEGRSVDDVDDDPIVRRPSRRPLMVPTDAEDDVVARAPKKAGRALRLGLRDPVDEDEAADDVPEAAPAAWPQGKARGGRVAARPASLRKFSLDDDEEE